MKAIHLLTIIVIIFCGACLSNNRRFPQEKKLSEYAKTEFVLTLENKISEDKNAVYCVPLLYAWDEIRKELGRPLKVDSQLNDLNLLNNSKSYLNVLSEDEYSVKAKVVENDIIAEAFFSKSLPFSEKLSSFRDSLIFDKTKVTSFGLLGNDYAVLYVVEILYYNDDNNFVIKILLKDANHEIILAKFDRRFETMIEMFSEIQNKIVLGKEEQENQALNWKYRIMSNDEVVIPKLQFNISTNKYYCTN